MSEFQPAIDQLLKDEGTAYVPDDHGRGPSRYGITLKSAQEIHPSWTAADILALNADSAAEYYQEAWWDKYKFGLIADQALAAKAFNLAVNSGPAGVIRALQQVAGTFQDGIMGPATADALNRMDPAMALEAFKSVMMEHYAGIEQAHPEWAANFAGWRARVLA